MGVAKKTRKFAQVKRVLSRRDNRVVQAKTKNQPDPKKDQALQVQHIPQAPSSLFFQANEALKPPYNVLLDTNFFSHTVRAKIDPLEGLMDLLYAKCIPTVTDCVIAEIEKLGDRFRIAQRVAKDERWKRITCDHKGSYADDCICTTVQKHRIYLVGTNDKELRQRLRKIVGVPLISVGRGKYSIERLPDAMV